LIFRQLFYRKIIALIKIVIDLALVLEW